MPARLDNDRRLAHRAACRSDDPRLTCAVAYRVRFDDLYRLSGPRFGGLSPGTRPSAKQQCGFLCHASFLVGPARGITPREGRGRAYGRRRAQCRSECRSMTDCAAAHPQARRCWTICRCSSTALRTVCASTSIGSRPGRTPGSDRRTGRGTVVGPPPKVRDEGDIALDGDTLNLVGLYERFAISIRWKCSSPAMFRHRGNELIANAPGDEKIVDIRRLSTPSRLRHLGEQAGSMGRRASPGSAPEPQHLPVLGASRKRRPQLTTGQQRQRRSVDERSPGCS